MKQRATFIIILRTASTAAKAKSKLRLRQSNNNNMAEEEEQGGGFPPPLKGQLPSDVSHPVQLRQLMRREFPWGMFPGTTTIVVLGEGAPPPFGEPPGGDPGVEDDQYRAERRDVGYLSYILAAWQRACISLGNNRPEWNFPTPDDVRNANASTTTFDIFYFHMGTDWRSTYFIKVDARGKRLIIHLANDGYLYMDTASMGTIDTITTSYRHPDTAPHGWMVFEERKPSCPEGKRQEIYTALSDFRAFAEAWFGTDDLRQSVLYNNQLRRIDICFESKEENRNRRAGLEFSFERGWPCPPDDDAWWS